jgi:type IV pilus assembly protein PilC
MLNFSYTVKNKDGKIVKGVIEAESKEKLIEYFQKEGCIIFSIAESKKKAKTPKGGKVKIDDLVVFSRQFTTLIESAIPVVESLEILKEQAEKSFFKEILAAVLKDIKEGSSLSSAFAKHSKVFHEIYISMVEAGEASGKLPEILERVSVYLEKTNALRKKIISALFYPAVVVLMAIAITAFLLIKVVPTFKGIFDSLGGKLPLPTQILISISTFLSQPVTLLSIGLGIFIGAVLFF